MQPSRMFLPDRRHLALLHYGGAGREPVTLSAMASRMGHRR
jgi:hypothetical protein